MFSVEAIREQHVRVLHQVGEHQLALTLQLRDGDSADARVAQAFQDGLLPSCLYRPTLEYVLLAIRDSLSSEDSLGCGDLGELHQGARRASFGVDSVLDRCLLEIEDRAWPRILPGARSEFSRGCPPFPGREACFWCAYDFLLRHRPAFFRTIGTLEESYLKGLQDLQLGLRKAICQLQGQQSMEMENWRQKAEDGQLDSCGSRNVHDLVAQHVSELDVVQLHWHTNIEELKSRQKASYSDLIVDFFEQECKQVDDSGGGDWRLEEEREAIVKLWPPGKPLCTETLERPLDSDIVLSSLERISVTRTDGNSRVDVETRSGDVCGQDSAIGAAGRDLRVLAEVRTAFGPHRALFVLRLLVGDVVDLLPSGSAQLDAYAKDCEETEGTVGANASGTSSVAAAAAAGDDGAGPQLPLALVGLSSHRQKHFVRAAGIMGDCWRLPVLWADPDSAARLTAATVAAGYKAGVAPSPPGVGSSRKLSSLYKVYRSPSMRFWGVPRLPPPVSLSPNAYADQLRGIVIPTPENLKFEMTQAAMLREFATRCHRVTDLHFAPLSEQLRQVRATTAASPLRCGDYFCTRHSNLGGEAQVAFHLLVGSSELPASDDIPATLHRALWRLVSDCHHCRVADLTFPLLLVDIGASETSLPYAVAQRRSENVLRALKGALLRLAEELAPSELPELQVVNLVLPASSMQSISSGLPSVAESVLVFLRNSFQLV